MPLFYVQHDDGQNQDGEYVLARGYDEAVKVWQKKKKFLEDILPDSVTVYCKDEKLLIETGWFEVHGLKSNERLVVK